MSFVFVILAFFGLTSCGNPGGKKSTSGERVPLITVSVPPQEWFVKAVGGDSVEVSTLMPQGADPETFEPGIKQLSALARSRAYLAMGWLPFEEAAIENIRRNNPRLQVFRLVEGIEPVYGTHNHLHHGPHANDAGETGGEGCEQHHHGVPDPHSWSSVANAKIIASNTLKALSEAAPEKAPYYRKRYDALISRLDSLEGVYDKKLGPKAGSSFAIWHPSLSYFARDYGLCQIAVGDEGKESSVAGLRRRIDAARSQGVGVMFVQRDIDPRQAETARQEAGVPMVVINPLSEDWQGQMDIIVNALAGEANVQEGER